MITAHHISIGWNTATTCIGRQVTRDALGTRPQKAMLRLSGVEGNRISQVDASMQSPEIWTKDDWRNWRRYDSSSTWIWWILMIQFYDSILIWWMRWSHVQWWVILRDRISWSEMRFRRSNGETHIPWCHFWLFGLIPRGSSPRGSSWAFQKHKRMPNAPREAAWATSDLCILYNLYYLYTVYTCIYYCITIAVALLILQCHDSDPTCLTTLEQVDGTLVGCKSLVKRLQWHAMAQRCQNNSGHIWRCFKSLEKGNRQNLEIQIGVTSKWLFL